MRNFFNAIFGLKQNKDPQQLSYGTYSDNLSSNAEEGLVSEPQEKRLDEAFKNTAKLITQAQKNLIGIADPSDEDSEGASEDPASGPEVLPYLPPGSNNADDFGLKLKSLIEEYATKGLASTILYLSLVACVFRYVMVAIFFRDILFEQIGLRETPQEVQSVTSTVLAIAFMLADIYVSKTTPEKSVGELAGRIVKAIRHCDLNAGCSDPHRYSTLLKVLAVPTVAVATYRGFNALENMTFILAQSQIPTFDFLQNENAQIAATVFSALVGAGQGLRCLSFQVFTKAAGCDRLHAALNAPKNDAAKTEWKLVRKALIPNMIMGIIVSFFGGFNTALPLLVKNGKIQAESWVLVPFFVVAMLNIVWAVKYGYFELFVEKTIQKKAKELDNTLVIHTPEKINDFNSIGNTIAFSVAIYHMLLLPFKLLEPALASNDCIKLISFIVTILVGAFGVFPQSRSMWGNQPRKAAMFQCCKDDLSSPRGPEGSMDTTGTMENV